MLGNLTGLERDLVIAGVAAVPLLIGLLVGRWWTLWLAFSPLVLGWLLYRDREGWGLMALYVPALAVLIAVGVVMGRTYRRRASASQRK